MNVLEEVKKDKVGTVEKLYKNEDFVHINYSVRKPWCAKLFLNEKGELEREFLKASEWDNRIPLYSFKKYLNSIIELNGGSRMNEYRAYLYVDKDGNVYHIDTGSIRKKELRDKISQLLKEIEANSTEQVSLKTLIAREIAKIEKEFNVKIKWEILDEKKEKEVKE